MVPLQNAHISGGWKWDKEKKKEDANYLDDPKHLLAVSYSANRQKGEQAPDDWKPKDEAFWSGLCHRMGDGKEALGTDHDAERSGCGERNEATMQVADLARN